MAATSATARAERDKECLRRFTNLMGRAERAHDKRVKKFQTRHDAYRGFMSQEEKARWLRPLAPKYALHSLEVLVSNLADDHIKAAIKPVSKDDVERAKSFERVIAVQRRRANRQAKELRWVRETAIMGAGPAKLYWNNETRDGYSTRWARDQIDGSWQQTRTPELQVLHDEPDLAPLDVYDWFPDPSASRPDEMAFAIARYWVPLDLIKQMERTEHDDGTVTGCYRNVDQVAETRSPGKKDGRLTGREHGDCVEVCELWTSGRLVVVANRSVVLQDDENPYDHGQIPFVVAHTIPDLYTMDGLSVVEVVAPLQAAAWEVLNGLIENVRIGSQLIAKGIRGANIDDDALELVTGQVLWLDDQSDLDFWHAGAAILEPSLSTLDVLVKTMEETSGANAYLAGGASGSIDQKTATGISIVSSMAQKLVLLWKQTIGEQREAAGQMEIALNQQLLTRAEEVRIDEDAESVTHVFPWDLTGRFDYVIEDVDQSLNDQQRRAEAGMLFNMLFPTTQLPRLPGATIGRLEPMMEDLVESYGKENVERYLETVPVPPPMLGVGPLSAGGPAGLSGLGTPLPSAGAGAGLGGPNLAPALTMVPGGAA